MCPLFLLLLFLLHYHDASPAPSSSLKRISCACASFKSFCTFLRLKEVRGEEGRGEQTHERRGEQAHERRGEQAHYYMSASIELAGGRNLTPSPSLTMSC